MTRSRILIIAFVIIALDQLAKFFVLHSIAFKQSVTLIPGVLALNHVNNTGIAFSLLDSFPQVLTIFISGLMIYIISIFFRYEELGVFWGDRKSVV